MINKKKRENHQRKPLYYFSKGRKSGKFEIAVREVQRIVWEHLEEKGGLQTSKGEKSGQNEERCRIDVASRGGKRRATG